MPVSDLTATDFAAVIWLLACWVGYTRISERRAAAGNLIGVMARNRESWMMRMLGRENRMLDIQIVNASLNTGTFFASTSILIIAGLFASLAAPEEVIAVIREAPYAVATSRALWVVKVMTLMLIFVHGFFKFAWSMRQFNYCATLIGAAPPMDGEVEQHSGYACNAARVASLAARHFNHGVRAYYFGMAALSWFINPLALFPAALLVVAVLYRRESHSRTLKALAACAPDE